MKSDEIQEKIERIFHGRSDELAALSEWVSSDQKVGQRAGVIVGTPGRGKSALLTQFQRRCASNHPAWQVQLLEATGQQGAAEVMSHMLGQMLAEYEGMVARGPRDREGLAALLRTVPSVGDLLAYLVKEDNRPGWQKFLDFVERLDDAVRGKNASSRLIFIVDPKPEFAIDHPGDWIPLVEKLPSSVRLIIAQRPDDTLVAHPAASRHFSHILSSQLSDLSPLAVQEWYEDAFKIGLLPNLDGGKRRAVSHAAYERYAGYPLAHHALIGVLAFESISGGQLPDTIRKLPRKTEALLDELYAKLRGLGRV